MVSPTACWYRIDIGFGWHTGIVSEVKVSGQPYQILFLYMSTSPSKEWCSITFTVNAEKKRTLPLLPLSISFNSELLVFLPGKIIIPNLIVNQSTNKQTFSYYTCSKVLKKRPAAEKASRRWSQCGDSSWRPSRTVRCKSEPAGSCRCSGKRQTQSQFTGLKLGLCCPLVVKWCWPRVSTDTFPARLAQWGSGEAGPPASHPSCLPLSESIFGGKKKI